LLTQICLSLLFLTNFNQAFGGTITTEFKVVKNPSPLFRRADIIFNCPTENPKENFILEVEKRNEGARITIKFQGKGIEVIQKLPKVGKIVEVKLEKIDPLLGKVGEIEGIKATIEGEKAKIEVKNLQQGFYQLTYTINPLKERKLFSPEVIIFGKEREGKEIIEFTVPIFFKPGEYRISEKNAMVLSGLKRLKEFCDITIVGYANGTPVVHSQAKSNKKLAEKRALSVKNFFEEAK